MKNFMCFFLPSSYGKIDYYGFLFIKQTFCIFINSCFVVFLFFTGFTGSTYRYSKPWAIARDLSSLQFSAYTLQMLYAMCAQSYTLDSSFCLGVFLP